ncbi:MAG: hypothetical protein M1817_004294 [Caeruleum heppii]|nr:MAG: hypothetical protein M1817_004294 [Caeruleum heppii]
MEAASARMAARDRFGSLGDPGPSPLQRYIQSACDPTNYEPNLALNLEIADLINSKKGNAPREAAVGIVNYVNHRNPNVSLLALSLLDICVKNCGYPFHLQISTKDFLNELVRRFPERPPIRPSRAQLKVLELIEEWRQTICQTSRYKEDLGFIRDMHRLLSFKGYMFPEVRREDAAVLNPSDNLKSAEEMEEEERAAQSAKLQELIRRGGPQDLQQANQLMKVMAGYDTKHKTDYRAKAAEEVGKIQQKAKILEEMLQSYKTGDIVAEGDVFEELASSLQNAQPKIQKMCEEESDDQEAVAKLFEINDSIHRTIERYKLVKKGDLDGASKIPKGTLGTSTGVGKTADNELSLIDFGGDNEPRAGGPDQVGSSGSAMDGTGKVENLEEDLLGLSFQDSSYGQGGGITLGNTAMPPTSTTPTPLSGMASGQSFPPPSSTPAPPSFPPLPPNYSAFSSTSTSGAPSQSVTPAPPLPQPQRPPAPAAADPFASIISSAPRQSSPFTTQAPQAAASGNLLDSTTTASSTPPPAHTPQSNGNTGDNEEWTFSSATSESSSLPTTSELTISNSAIRTELAVSRQSGSDPTINLVARFSNNTGQPISKITFQMAVTKVRIGCAQATDFVRVIVRANGVAVAQNYSLRMMPPSGQSLAMLQRHGIQQVIYLDGVTRGQGGSMRMRWKLSYESGGQLKEEQGEMSGLGVA